MVSIEKNGVVIVCANPKGGSGKSTTTLLLADQYSEKDLSVCVIDADPNKTIKTWADCRLDNDLELPFDVVHETNTETIVKTIERLSTQYDVVIVDLEGTASSVVAYAIARAHLVLIPMLASALDGNMALKAIRLVENQAHLLERKIEYRIVFQAVATGSIKSSIQTQLENYFDSNDYKRLKAAFTLRTGPYRQIFSQAVTLRELEEMEQSIKGKSSIMKARQEASIVAMELYEVLSNIASKNTDNRS